MEQHKNGKNWTHRMFWAFIFRIERYFERTILMDIVTNMSVKVEKCTICVHYSLCGSVDIKSAFLEANPDVEFIFKPSNLIETQNEINGSDI